MPRSPHVQAAATPRDEATPAADAINRRLLSLGRLQFRLEHLRADMDSEVNRARALYADRIQRLMSEIIEQDAALEVAVAEARADIMPGRAKTASFAFGSVFYRTTPPAVKLLRGVEPEAAAQKLRSLGHSALVRERLEPNLPVIKDALNAGEVRASDLKSAGILVEPGAERFGHKLDRTAIQQVGD